VIGRAACAAVVLLAGSLASSSAAAQPATAAAPIAPLPPPWLLPPPPAYRTTPMIFRDGAWEPFNGFFEPEPPPLPGTAHDPLFPAGITFAITGLVTATAAVGWLVSAGSSRPTCGLSGCLQLADRESQNYATGLIAGGATAALFGGMVAYVGAKGPAPARVSNARAVTGLALTSIGVGIMVTGLVNAVSPYNYAQTVPGEVIPPGAFGQQAYTSGSTLIFTLVSTSFLDVGLPLWLTGVRSRSRRHRPSDDASRLDLLPSAGGAALRWTR
jgi:hypothetical protein